MNTKRTLTLAGVLFALALPPALVPGDGPPAKPPPGNAQLGQPLAAGRGEGKLMPLPVPKATVFKTKTGLTGWKLKIPGGRPLATPAVVDGILYVGGGFGSHEFYALDAASGKRRWTFKCGDDGPTAAVVSDDCVAYNTESCTLYIHDARTGKVLWHRWLGDPLMSQPAIGGGLVLMAYPGKGGHLLAAFKLRTGKPVWKQKIAAEVITAPIIAGNDVVVATVDGSLYRFDLATGKLLWSVECRVTSAPRVLGRRVFISQRGEKTIAIKGPKGKTSSSKFTVEGLNVAALTDGKLAHGGPQAAVKAAFLLPLARQFTVYSANAANSVNGQIYYNYLLKSSSDVLNSVKGNPVPEADELIKQIEQLLTHKATDDPTKAVKHAEQVLKLAGELEKIAARKPDNEKERRAFEQLRKTADLVRALADATKQSAEAAAQAKLTIAATKKEGQLNQALDAGVGFAQAPPAAKLQLAAGNIGQGHVKAVWAYQGSRPCLFAGMSIMVHGPKMRAVDLETGQVRWEHGFDCAADATRPVTPPALAGGRLYVGTTDGRIVCVDARKGKRLWQATVGGRILFEPAVVKGRVYAATDDGSLICLRINDKSADGWPMWGGSPRHNGSEK